MTEIDAVNEILEAIGQPAVTSVPGADNGSDEWEAKVKLDRHRKRVLQEGWNTNTIKEKTYSPASGEITLTDVLWFEKTTPGSPTNPLTMRNGKLYDLKEESDNSFTGDVELNVRVDITDFTHIPDYLAALIVKKAALDFATQKRPGTRVIPILQQEVIDARRDANRADARERPTDIHCTDHQQRVLGNRRRPHLR